MTSSVVEGQMSVTSTTRELFTNSHASAMNGDDWITLEDPQTFASTAMGEVSQFIKSDVSGYSKGYGTSRQDTHVLGSGIHGTMMNYAEADSFAFSSAGNAISRASLLVNFSIAAAGDYALNASVRSFNIRDGGTVAGWTADVFVRLRTSGGVLIGEAAVNEPGASDSHNGVHQLLPGSYVLEVLSKVDTFSHESQSNISSEAIFSFAAVPAPASAVLAAIALPAVVARCRSQAV